MWPGRGERIRTRRETLGMKGPGALAQRMKPLASVSRQAVIKWENDDSVEIKATNMRALVAALQTTEAWISGDSSATPDPATAETSAVYQVLRPDRELMLRDIRRAIDTPTTPDADLWLLWRVASLIQR